MHARVNPGPDTPPLEAGDCLDRAEFHRRYLASPHIKKAELIDGVVYVPSPVKRKHSKPTNLINTWLGTYWAATPGVEALDDTTLVLDGENEVQPDALLRRLDGPCQETPDGYLGGPPELVAEVANSSTAYDLNQKRAVYERNGVREYVVLLAREGTVRWYDLVGGQYIERDPPEDGVYRSHVFPGLWLDVEALVSGDRRLFDALRAGLDSQAHADFVAAIGAD